MCRADNEKRETIILRHALSKEKKTPTENLKPKCTSDQYKERNSNTYRVKSNLPCSILTGSSDLSKWTGWVKSW